MIRLYVAYIDDGHDFKYCDFYSEHRANSKANYEDARRAMRQCGYRGKITSTQLKIGR